MSSEQTKPLRVLLCGDVMTGRGIDQVLPHPGNPGLHEYGVRDAGEYVELAEKAHGQISRPVSFQYIWGDALAERGSLACSAAHSASISRPQFLSSVFLSELA